MYDHVYIYICKYISDQLSYLCEDPLYMCNGDMPKTRRNWDMSMSALAVPGWQHKAQHMAHLATPSVLRGDDLPLTLKS